MSKHRHSLGLLPDSCVHARLSIVMCFVSLSLNTSPMTLASCCNQVEHEGQHRSCCAVVKGLQRSVFFVPAPGVFDGEELASLEAAAAADAADAGARAALLRHLHVRTYLMCMQSSISGARTLLADGPPSSTS